MLVTRRRVLTGLGAFAATAGFAGYATALRGGL